MFGVVGGGGGGGGVEAAPTLTLSNAAVVVTDVSWLVTARPARTLEGIDVAVLPTSVHDVPFGDTDAVTVLPLRVSFSHAGTPCALPAMNAVAPPLAER